MFRKEHHTIYLVLLTGLAVLIFYLISVFFSPPLHATPVPRAVEQKPLVQTPSPRVVEQEPPAIIEIVPPRIPDQELPKVIVPSEPVKAPESPIPVPGEPEIKHIEPEQKLAPLPVPQPGEKASPATQPQPGVNVPAANGKHDIDTDQYHHHKRHKHHHKGGHLRKKEAGPLVTFPYLYDYFSEPPASEVAPYEDDLATPEDESVLDFENRYALANKTGELYVDASEITSDDRLDRLQGIQHLDLTVVNADDETFKRLLVLTNLESLKIAGKKVTKIPEGIAVLKELNWLDLSNNNITMVPPEIGQLLALEVLVLSGNKIKTLPRDIGKLTQLKGLYVSNAELASLPVEITRLTQLKYLDLSGNPSSALDKPEVKLWVNRLISKMAQVRI